MSWIERNQNRVKITTGDGQVYEPDYLNAEYEQGYNLSEFEFRNVPGTLVIREQPKGRRFRLEIIFQGELNLENAERFRQSTFDKRAWRINHPKYDELIVHPISLRFDDTKQNVTTITGTIVETISGAFPNTVESPSDEILAKKTVLDETSALFYEQEISQFNLNRNDAKQINDNISNVELATNLIIEVDEEAADFKNKIVVAQNKINNAIGDATGYIFDVQSVINYPFQVTSSVNNRINALINAFNLLPFDNLTRVQKKYYETSVTASLSSMCVSAITDADYESRSDVDFVIEKITNSFNDYVGNIDSLQTETSTEIDSYSPSEESLRGLYDIVGYTLSRLLEIALGSRQELIYVVPEETNPILLTHRIYGLDQNDDNLQTLIKTNNIGINELLRIAKGREIKYYA